MYTKLNYKNQLGDSNTIKHTQKKKILALTVHQWNSREFTEFKTRLRPLEFASKPRSDLRTNERKDTN